MENAEKLTLPKFAPVAWSPLVASLLLPSVDGDELELAALRRRIEAKTADVLGVFTGAELIAACVMATEGDEAVILAAGGHWSGGSLLNMLLPVLELGFLNAGFRSVRVDTFRRGLMNKITAAGYRPAFVAFRKGL